MPFGSQLSILFPAEFNSCQSGVDKGGVLNYSSKPTTTFWKLDVTTMVIGTIIGITIITCNKH